MILKKRVTKNEIYVILKEKEGVKKVKEFKQIDISVHSIKAWQNQVTSENWSFFSPFQSKYFLYYVQSGEAIFHYPDEDIHVKEGDVLFRDGALPFHSEGKVVPFRTIAIRFKTEREHCVLPIRNHYRFPNKGYYKYQFTRIHQEYNTERFGYKLRIKATLYSLLNDLLLETIQTEYNQKELHRFMEVTGWIESEFADKNLTVEELAGRCLMNVSSFRKMFHNVYQASPKKYIMDFRMKQAVNMLCFTDIPVSDIADAVGYSDIYYFSAAFKKIFGVSPSQYRKNLQKKESD